MLENQTVRKTAVVTLGILALFLLAQTLGEFQSYRFIGSSPSAQSLISVSGKGEVVGIPDIATFSFSVTEESLLVKEAQDSAAEKTNAILKYLKDSGVAEKDIKTAGYNIYPRYEYNGARTLMYPPQSEGKQTLAAYVVSQSVSVKVRKLEDAGKALAGIGELGATNISDLSFDFDKRDELVREARDKAIQDARKEAAKLAKSLGVRLVRIISYNEGGYYPVYARAEAAYGMGGDMVAPKAAPEIPVGEDKITSNVTITYEVK